MFEIGEALEHTEPLGIAVRSREQIGEAVGGCKRERTVGLGVGEYSGEHFDRALGTISTIRNWRTVETLASTLAAKPAG